MKKKILLLIGMFLFITNVNALTFDVDLTNIEYKGNNGTSGSITNIDIPNKSINTLFKNIGDEVSFDLTITNSGNRAGILKSILVTSSNDKIEYTNDLPIDGLSINGNDTNKVTITAKVLAGAVNGTSLSTIKILYNYDEGSCPEGEILSEDETMCLCPEGTERNDSGICVEPEQTVECADDEVYNETEKICEKKEAPVDPTTENPTTEDPTTEDPTTENPTTEDPTTENPTTEDPTTENPTTENPTTENPTTENPTTENPITENPTTEEPTTEKPITEKPTSEVKETVITPSNPKTRDNIILITLLFIVSGLGIYVVLYKRLNTKRKRVTAGVITGVITLGLSFATLIGTFGTDNLLSAIMNPITKTKEITLTVNETIEMEETWSGYCTANSYAPGDLFEGGSGTEEDPYQIKTSEQLLCFALSVNDGNSYEGKFIKQTKDIKLNDNLIETAKAGDTSGLKAWTPIGDSYLGRSFSGTYDGNNHSISGVYLTDEKLNQSAAKGLFGYTSNATIKNLSLSDTFISFETDWVEAAGSLIGLANNSLTVKNVTTSGETGVTDYGTLSIPSNSAGVIGKYNANGTIGAKFYLEDITNNVSPVLYGIVSNMYTIPTETEEPNVIIKNVTNNGSFVCSGIFKGGSMGSTYQGYFLLDNVTNKADSSVTYSSSCNNANGFGEIISAQKIVIKNSHNEGVLTKTKGSSGFAGLVLTLNAADSIVVENCYNTGNMYFNYDASYLEGVTSTQLSTSNSGGRMAGLVGEINARTTETTILIKDSYNSGIISGFNGEIGGIIAYNQSENFTMDNCQNIGAINAAYSKVGGLAAISKGTIKNSNNTGTITIWGFKKNYPVGGLVGLGKNSTYSSSTEIAGATIIDSYNTGDIIVTAKKDEVSVGGLCGICSNISGSYNSGNITSKYATQYFDGIGFRTLTVTDTEFTGTITTENLTY